MTQAGWLEVYGRKRKQVSLQSLVRDQEWREGTRARRWRFAPARRSPPARSPRQRSFRRWKAAEKLVEDEELREAMSEKGLGTPATRAQIIEGLIYEDYIHRSGRELQPTPKASSLLFALRISASTSCVPRSSPVTGNSS